MPKPDDHIKQVINNLEFLQKTDSTIEGFFDWKVTVCFYTAVHLINSHLANFGLQYRNHGDVNNALNPYSPLSLSKLPEDEYVAYLSLQSLSRRSRYLVSEKDSNLKSDLAFSTYEKQYAKGVRHLDRLLKFFAQKYKYNINPISVKCSELTQNDHLEYFKI